LVFSCNNLLVRTLGLAAAPTQPQTAKIFSPPKKKALSLGIRLYQVWLRLSDEVRNYFKGTMII
jgi:hypothetical protein